MAADQTRPRATGYGYAPEVQRKVVALAYRDPTAYGQLGGGVFNADLVLHAPLKPVARALFKACQEGGGRPPSPEMAEELVRDALTWLTPTVATQARQEWELVKTADLSDARLLRAKAAEWAREAAVVKAVLKGAELVDRLVGGGAGLDGQGTALVRMFQDALTIGKGAETGIRLVRDAAAAGAEMLVRHPRVPTGFAPLDRAMEGGPEPGLHMMAGAPKIGKTAFLTQLAAEGCRRGYFVWYISGEVTLRPMIRRTLCSLTGYTRHQVQQDPQRIAERMGAAYSQTGGEILLEYAPGFTVDWMASRLRQIEAEGDRVGLVVADFIDLMRGREQAERRHELEDIGKRLRDLAVEARLPIWTAKALNRRAVTKAVPTEADLAECFGLVYVVDNLLVLCATEAEQQRKETRGGREVKAPIIRIWYAVAREREDKFLVGAFDRNNDRQRWTHLPNYRLEEAPGTAGSTGG